jgi:hypothetical protein
MEGISKIMFQGKIILVVDFAEMGKTKETTKELINAAAEEFMKQPLNSVLGLMDISKIYFHIDTMHAFKELQEKTSPYGKKVAVVGVKGLIKTSFNAITASEKKVRAFNTEAEAKEWLVSE